MKTKNIFSILASAAVVATMGMSSCSTGTDGDEGELFDAVKDGSYTLSGEIGSSGDAPSEGFAIGNGVSGTNGNTQAGVVTAGEWNDLNHWPFWSSLMLSDEFGSKSAYWEFYTNNRVDVKVTTASGQAVAGVPVSLLRGGSTVWQAVTDNHGEATCWVGLSQKETADAKSLTVAVDGQLMEGHPFICTWDSIETAKAQSIVNSYVYTKTPGVKQSADIAFIVDATGSMSDEIDFLKSDLEDIIGKVASVRPSVAIRTAALFYRDEGDEYLTRHSNFTDKLSTTKEFVGEQSANGGGDYPEAVHTALERMLQDLSWDNSARIRLAFMVLDAPAHHEAAIIQSLQHSIQLCARQGIRIIPVAASGVDKNTEFMLRFFAIATGGTYVFLTNDSGVGNDHIAATVGKYEVEQLNQLLIRLIEHYTE